ncbi:MAG TPA: hypothetical protein VFC89_00095, partial [Oscillospiraceae bacterium]|nr:hypothetical protein [Oscillospiraceae bacterium]
DGGISVFSNITEYRDAEKESDKRKFESKKAVLHRTSSEKEERDAASAEIVPEMPLWDKQAIHLYPLLADLKQYPRNRSERRRIVADINELLRDLESNLSQHQEEKISLEKNFTLVDSGEIYHDYAELLQTIEIEELLYLQLMEVAEDIKG